MRNRNNELLERLNQFGADLKLYFTGQVLLKGCILGLDAVRRKLLAVQVSGDVLVDLNEVESCSVKKTYSSIHAEALRERELDDYLECVALRFEFTTGKPPVEVVFYSHSDNSPLELPVLEQKARNWQVMLSKMLNGRLPQEVPASLDAIAVMDAVGSGPY